MLAFGSLFKEGVGHEGIDRCDDGHSRGGSVGLRGRRNDQLGIPTCRGRNASGTCDDGISPSADTAALRTLFASSRTRKRKHA
jgi:hypothetical protein